MNRLPVQDPFITCGYPFFHHNILHHAYPRSSFSAQDGNCGVLFERMARALVLCSSAGGTAEEQRSAGQRRATARTLLLHARPLVEQATKEGLADLT